MTTTSPIPSRSSALPVHRGPHPGMLALLYMLLFCAGLYPVTNLYKEPYWPPPWEPTAVILNYFQHYGGRVLFCITLQFGAWVCFAIFAAAVVSRLHFLGARAAGTYIALLGSFLVVADAFAGTMAMWTLLRPVVNQNGPLVLALNFFAYGLGGPGFSVPMGLFIAGISVTSAFLKALPRWLVISGLVLAAAGELSWLHLAVFPALLFLIPLVRFPGFLWLIAVGFKLPKSRRSLGATDPLPASP